MRLPALFLLVISVSMGLEQESCYLSQEEEDQCASVCYPIVKPLMRYFEVCQTKDRTNAELQNSLNEINLKYSKLMEKHSATQDKSTDVEVKSKEVHTRLIHTSRDLRNFQRILHQTNIKLEQFQSKLHEVNLNYSDEQGKHPVGEHTDFLIKFYKDRLKNAEEKINQNNMKYAELEKRFRDQNRELIESRQSLNRINFKNDQLQDELNDVNLQNAKLRAELEEKDNVLYDLITKNSQNIHLEDRNFEVKPKVYINPQIERPGPDIFKKSSNIDGEIGSGWRDDF